MTAPDEASVARFRRDVVALLGREPERPLALAVSGGPDSMAMLALAHAAGFEVIAATVDHRLRQASAVEAARVARHCAAIGVPHAVLVPDEPIGGSSIQAAAREARYALLTRWAMEAGSAALLTAHHADDQAETFLMRAARGSGMAGLAGIRARRELTGAFDQSLILLRPLLAWRRDALRAIAEAARAPHVDDPSNADRAFDRTRFRELLARNPELDVLALAASATYAAETEQALVEIADREWLKRRFWDAPDVRFDPAGLQRELRRRLTRYAIDAVRADAGIVVPAWGTSTAIEPLLDSLEAGRAATQAGVLVRPVGDVWRFSEAPARRAH